MPSTCTFSFDRRNPVFFSGETIHGSLSLHTSSEKNVRGIYIIFDGAAKVRWEESRSRTTNVRTEHYNVHYSGDETYLNTRTRVFGEGKLAPGTYEYAFNITLPLECPTSCTEEYGIITYKIKLKLERHSHFDNVFIQPLSVIKQQDLNQSPELLLPVIAEDIKYFCFWPCSSGPVISTLTIPFGGWAPGQEIPYKLEIDNQSPSYGLGRTTLKLVQTYNFTAHSPEHKTRTYDNILVRKSQKDRPVFSLTKRIFQGKLRIPPVPPTSMDSGIITVSYRIELTVLTGEKCIPITIGTIPLAQSATSLNQIIAIPPTAPSPDIPDTPDTLDKPPSYDMFMPPTFEEATHIGKKFKDTDKDEYQNKSIEGWVPKYPMYSDFAVPAAASAPPDYSNEEYDVMQSAALLNVGFNANIMPPNGSFLSNLQSPHRTLGGFVSIPPTPGCSQNY